MKKTQGFTLIEIMIVVVIVGILSSIAFGAYHNNVIATNRTEGRSALQTAANTLEKCRALYGTYDNANCNYADFTSETNKYDIAGVIGNSTFVLTATPAANSPQADDSDCTTLTLSNTGIKSGTGADPGQCW